MKKLSLVSAHILAALSLIATTATLTRAVEREAREVPIMKPSDDPSWKLDFSFAEMIAVQEGRRKKPLQTHAFETIEQIVGRPLIGATFYKDQSIAKDTPFGKDMGTVGRLNSMDLFLSIWMFPEYWDDKPLILVTNNDLRKKLKLPITVLGADAGAYAGTGRELYFDESRVSIRDLLRGENQSELIKILLEIKAKGADAKLSDMEADAKLAYTRIELIKQIQMADKELSMVPHPSDTQGTWDPILKLFVDTRAAANGDSSKLVYKFDDAKKACDAFRAFRETYMARDVAGFALASKNFKESLQALSPTIYPTDSKLGIEIQYNNERPFAKAWIFYLFAAIIALFAIRFKVKAIYLSALAFYVIGLGLHVYGFVLRCIIAGRPPVSNMYESVIWVGFGAVFFGLILESIYRKRYYILAGSTAGFLCLVLMDMLPVLVGNTEAAGIEAGIKPLQPVLRSNYWLTIHVLTITLSYAAFMLAWGMGHITLFSHLFRPTQRAEHHELHNLVYRIMQIGVLLLSIGTILGGVWAYYSWGRFWGWDPKETWAFIALMCYIVVLHGRFAGLWTNFGLAFGSVLCFQAIVMAWYGVNFVLGSGLHAYGSGAGGQGIVLTLVGLDMIFLAASTAQYLKYKNANKIAAKANNEDDDEDQSARGRVEDKAAAPENSGQNPQIKFS